MVVVYPRTLPTTCSLRYVWFESQSVGGGLSGQMRVTQPLFQALPRLPPQDVITQVSSAVCCKFDPQTLEEPQLASIGRRIASVREVVPARWLLRTPQPPLAIVASARTADTQSGPCALSD